jgi:hypothetical protein
MSISGKAAHVKFDVRTFFLFSLAHDRWDFRNTAKNSLSRARIWRRQKISQDRERAKKGPNEHQTCWSAQTIFLCGDSFSVDTQRESVVL